MEKRAAAIWLTILLKKQIKMKNTRDGIEEIWNGGINLGVWMICCACHALRQLGRCQLGRRQLGGHQLGQRELGRRHQTWVILGCWKKLETLVEAEETGRGRWGTNKLVNIYGRSLTSRRLRWRWVVGTAMASRGAKHGNQRGVWWVKGLFANGIYHDIPWYTPKLEIWMR